MDPLKVCLLNDSFPPTVDGVANVAFNYASILQEKHGAVIVGTPQYPGVVDEYPFPVVRYPSLDTTKLIGYRAGYPFNAFALRDLERDGIDIIHSHCPVASTLLARVLREGTNAPIIFTYHTKFDIDIAKAVEAHWLQTAAIKALVSNISTVDEVWVVSQGAGDNLRKLGYQGDYRLMPNGVDFPQGRAAPEDVLSLKKRHGVLPDEMVFLFVGRMMWYKGIRLILDALDRLRQDGRRFRMFFIGDGQDRGEIEAYTQSLDLSNLCTFTGIVHDRELLRTYFSLCDLFLFPSTFDTNGIVVREAAACGAPSLLIRSSCAAEGVTDGRNGLLCAEHADALAEALSTCFGKKAFLRSVGERAMEELYLSWEDAVDRAYVRYGQVLEEYRRSGRRHTERPGNLFTLAADISQSLKLAEDTRIRSRTKRPRGDATPPEDPSRYQ